MVAVKVGVLGPLELLVDGTRVAIGAAKERALLSLLSTRAGTAVGSSTLVDSLWGDTPPRSARKLVQIYVSNLRRVLPAGAIATVHEGYRFDIAPEQVDALAFRVLAAEGSAILPADPVTAATRLREALALWRGPALVELVDQPLGRAAAASLDETRRTCEEALAEARLSAGDHAASVADLEAAVAAEPLRERRWELLITALYRSGRRTDALRAYQNARRLLAEEVGLEPGVALKALEEAIILESPGLVLRPPVTGPPRRSRATAAAEGRARPPRTPAPLPSGLASGPASGVVGRAAELAWIADGLDRAASGDGLQVLLVSGEAGVGKTTLVAESARAAFRGGACVLHGQCEEDLRGPYQLFGEAMGHFVSHADEQVLRDHVARHGPELARIVPALGTRIGSLPPSKSADADTERYLLFAAVAGLLGTIAASTPLVVVFDDLQWADAGSLQLLRHLVRTGSAMRLLVLATYREDETASTHPLAATLADIYRHRATSRVDLKGLDDGDVARLLEAIAGDELGTAGLALARAVYRETDGNPFFVSEVFRHLAETGTIFQDTAGRWSAGGDRFELPESVRVVIGARVARLGTLAEKALSLASVIGRDFELDVLARVSRIPEDELVEVLERAGAAALVREVEGAPGHFTFAHALVQHTLYDDVGATRRARAHRAVAECLESLHGTGTGARLAELARHWTAASHTSELAGRALDYAHRAGDAALAALSPEDALCHFEQALDLMARAGNPDPVVPIDLAIGLGTAQHQTGDPAFGDTLLRAARQAEALGDTERLVAALLANDRDLLAAEVDEEKVALFDRALALVGAPSTERAMLLAGLHRELLFAPPRERCGALALEALAIVEDSGDDATIAAVINRVSLLTPLMLDRSLALSAEAVVRAERAGDPVLHFWASLRRAKVAAVEGDLDELDRCLDVTGQLASRLSQPILSFAHTMERSGRASIAGDADSAAELATEALELAEDRGLSGTGIGSAASMMTVSWIRGTLGEVAPLVEKAIAEHPGVTAFRSVLALAYAEAGEVGAATCLLDEFAATGFDLLPNPLWLTEMMGYGGAALECRAVKVAQAFHDQLRPWAYRFSYYSPATFGPVSHVLGGLAALLGRHEEAENYFARAACLSERMGARFFGARTDLAWGEMLAARGIAGDRARARQLLTKAHRTAEANGYARVCERAAEALAGI